jgi:signal transduction histidine kinase
MFRDKLQFSRERLEFIYSIAILVTIPVLLVLNTVLLSVSVRKNLDTELRSKSDMANSLIAAAVQPALDNPTELQDMVDRIKVGNEELQEIIIATPTDNGGYMITAASDEGKVRQSVDDLQFTIAATRQQSVAQLVTDHTGNRVWSVLKPITQDNHVIAIIGTSVSLKQADALIGNTLLRSLIFVGVTVIVIVLLLLNHFRFVEYAMLFRKLKEVDQLKSDFLSVATHELKAPMTVIKGNIENLIDGLTGTVDDTAKEALHGISAETDRLNSLVNDLLNVSRIEQGRITYDLKAIDARETIERITGQFHDKATAKGLTLTYEKPEQAVSINVDPGRFTEIMTNLIDNAIKYSVKGEIVVSHKTVDAQKTRISVRDTGLGMTAKERERLFSRFYRIQNRQTEGIPGTGLGLWIVKQYVEHMNGTITVDSLEGTGSEFIVEFPIAAA